MMSPCQEKISAVKINKIGGSRRLLIISRAFDQIQVFDQMLGGYSGKMKNSSMTK
jgi:hypothetical protein